MGKRLKDNEDKDTELNQLCGHIIDGFGKVLGMILAKLIPLHFDLNGKKYL